jgi:hypothetical protein
LRRPDLIDGARVEALRSAISQARIRVPRFIDVSIKEGKGVDEWFASGP